MVKYLVSSDGRKCPIDINNPLIMLNKSGLGREYHRGSIVFPIACNKGDKPGDHYSKGWMTVTTLNTDVANFCGIEIGKSAVSLKELLDISGKLLGISNNRFNFFKDGKNINARIAVDDMLEHYTIMQLPEYLWDQHRSSNVTTSELTLCESGIIFDSLDELAGALKVYDRGSLKRSSATEDQFYEDTFITDNPRLGVDDPSLFRKTSKAKFVDQALQLINEGRASLVDRLIAKINSSNGRFRKSFDYDAMGTSFFKTTIDVDKIDDKYILEINVAYVGEEPEIELAKTLGKERGLVSLGSIHYLSNIGTNWVGVDLEKVLKRGTLTNDQLSVLARISTGDHDRVVKNIVRISGEDLELKIALGQENNYKVNVLKVKDTQLYFKTEETGRPFLSLSITPVNEKTVSSDQKEKLTKIRDSLRETIDKNLS